MDTIIFVCTGNTCRSPLAEAIAQRWIDEHAGELPHRLLAASAGVAAADGVRPSPETVATLAGMGIPCEGRSKRLTAEMVRGARLVLCMTAGHASAVRGMVAEDPEQVRKIRLVDPDGDIEDPIGLGTEAYEEVARRLAVLVPLRIKELLDEDRAGVGSPRSAGDSSSR